MNRLLFFIMIFFAGLFVDGGLSHAGNIDSGKVKSETCAKCHGLAGRSENPAIPHLAGQPASYLLQQLKDFKNGVRKNAGMNALTASLNQADMEDLSAYYASLKSSPGKGDSALAARGKEKYHLCQDCHGPAALGQGPIPRLAGQYPGYTAAQLKAYQEGLRKNNIMNGIAKGLTDEDFKAIAEYTFGLE